MAATTSFCPNCGASVQPQAGFCANCGTRLVSHSSPPPQTTPGYSPPLISQQPPASTGVYKAVIAVLLIVIVLLGLGLYAGSSGRLFQLGQYHYQLANPPNYQSTQPPPMTTSQQPSTIIWNACAGSIAQGCSMTATGWREGSVPDTFDYYVYFTSTVNVTVYFFTMGQFVQFSVCNGDISCVSGYYDTIPATTSTTTVFTLGEGCADYLAIYVASGAGTMHPSVGVSQPAVPPGRPTGYCAQAGV